jgi:3-dehydroquinate dehydratase II
VNDLVYVITGPNLQLVGSRQPRRRCREAPADLEVRLIAYADDLGLNCFVRQVGSESALVDGIREAGDLSCGLIIDAAGCLRTSVPIVDALRLLRQPVIEVQLSNIHRQETRDVQSSVSQVATGVICGLGYAGYELALDAIASLLRDWPISDRVDRRRELSIGPQPDRKYRSATVVTREPRSVPESGKR